MTTGQLVSSYALGGCTVRSPYRLLSMEDDGSCAYHVLSFMFGYRRESISTLITALVQRSLDAHIANDGQLETGSDNWCVRKCLNSNPIFASQNHKDNSYEKVCAEFFKREKANRWGGTLQFQLFPYCFPKEDRIHFYVARINHGLVDWRTTAATWNSKTVGKEDDTKESYESERCMLVFLDEVGKHYYLILSHNMPSIARRSLGMGELKRIFVERPTAAAAAAAASSSSSSIATRTRTRTRSSSKRNANDSPDRQQQASSEGKINLRQRQPSTFRDLIHRLKGDVRGISHRHGTRNRRYRAALSELDSVRRVQNRLEPEWNSDGEDEYVAELIDDADDDDAAIRTQEFILTSSLLEEIRKAERRIDAPYCYMNNRRHDRAVGRLQAQLQLVQSGHNGPVGEILSRFDPEPETDAEKQHREIIMALGKRLFVLQKLTDPIYTTRAPHQLLKLLMAHNRLIVTAILDLRNDRSPNRALLEPLVNGDDVVEDGDSLQRSGGGESWSEARDRLSKLFHPLDNELMMLWFTQKVWNRTRNSDPETDVHSPWSKLVDDVAQTFELVCFRFDIAVCEVEIEDMQREIDKYTADEVSRSLVDRLYYTQDRKKQHQDKLAEFLSHSRPVSQLSLERRRDFHRLVESMVAAREKEENANPQGDTADALDSYDSIDKQLRATRRSLETPASTRTRELWDAYCDAVENETDPERIKAAKRRFHAAVAHHTNNANTQSVTALELDELDERLRDNDNDLPPVASIADAADIFDVEGLQSWEIDHLEVRRSIYAYTDSSVLPLEYRAPMQQYYAARGVRWSDVHMSFSNTDPPAPAYFGFEADVPRAVKDELGRRARQRYREQLDAYNDANRNANPAAVTNLERAEARRRSLPSPSNTVEQNNEGERLIYIWYSVTTQQYEDGMDSAADWFAQQYRSRGLNPDDGWGRVVMLDHVIEDGFTKNTAVNDIHARVVRQRR
jgi:hypothetical protein